MSGDLSAGISGFSSGLTGTPRHRSQGKTVFWLVGWALGMFWAQLFQPCCCRVHSLFLAYLEFCFGCLLFEFVRWLCSAHLLWEFTSFVCLLAIFSSAAGKSRFVGWGWSVDGFVGRPVAWWVDGLVGTSWPTEMCDARHFQLATHPLRSWH